ncbi:uncharacterized protein JN550_002516 [Neoarthrinium moseri]|uniref:uncharacterized protein n=1 Tax=Neoarthrinium moseri TaxID=1658444 RepID=UPI001FDBEB5C|nr:uncharacterized protein JN550_002516 [Neoarthrinium moseri]KAI1875087.1 hypothetical protein JN550_002516 [Neoarthrinium moseri]
MDDFLLDPVCSVSNGPRGPKGQQIAVASYISPLADPDAWTRLIGYPKEKVPILVANVVNGPDVTVDEPWKKVIDAASASGKTVIGYVRTGYLGLSQQQFTTRLGSLDLADWTAQIERDVDAWYELYGSSIGGIFFDEGWPECGPDNVYANLYKYINDYTKRAHPGAFTVLNPGSPMAHCYEDTMDTLLTFELSYEAYTQSYVPNDWVAKDPRKIWHIIYNVPESGIEEVAKLAHERGAGLIQITDDIMPNPYDNLPNDSYMQRHMNAVEGGVPLNEGASAWKGSAPGAVSGLSITRADYSSAHMTWDKASDALGYHVFLKKGGSFAVFASIPSTMTSITVGGLSPGSTNDFYVAAVGGDGHLGMPSNTASIATNPLPGGVTVTNYSSSPLPGSTTYTANILVPYAFIRLYIWDSVSCDFDENQGWTVNFKVDAYVCTHYFVEGTTLYKYSGTVPKGSTAAPWSWSVVGPVDLVVDRYTYKWTLPIGTSTLDTSKFVVQAQGYGPFINAFSPKPDDYDCSGSALCGSAPNFLKYCDHAANVLTRRDDFFYRDDDKGLTGNCWSNQYQGCGIFIQGDGSCKISGNDLWWAYQNIRNIGGCQKCGTWHRADGCNVKIDYVSECANHS